ncbi:siroheme synthase CysG [Pseudohoeflea coraliihabitans]|uniref:uroporphyrinogen-III C-methyltransferase n=1 Tax=Pseudohoeflea coraliihabitans TaxID=2860393 RepID=A0ABS6WTK4_9HYPH|nr:siroheme synthase CysG [Pseudohoeflea sp. DP4N28-3]MBW3098384.1 siroheme synthase CysG [Pseudohoeflea sp. DP4N28-3]
MSRHDEKTGKESVRPSADRLTAFPAFMRVEGRKVAIFGDGAEAAAKARLVANTSAAIILFAPHPGSELQAVLAGPGIAHVARPFAPDQLDGAALVFAATGDAAQDREIVAAARARNIPANAVDQPDHCDFFTPALVNRAPVAIAIGTEGAGPVLAQMIRARIDQLFAPSLGPLARLAASLRHRVEGTLPRGTVRRQFWQRFFEGPVAAAMAAGDQQTARRVAERLLAAPADGSANASGHVALVGAGPGAEDLLTLRAQRLLMQADVILHDALVPEAVVAMGRRDAERIPVGKRKGCHSKKQHEINELTVDLARQGKRVVRLKSGDPMIYGRAAEEIEALRDAGIGYEIVPGITSAFAAAADMALPLTLRGVASSLVFTTGHDLTGDTLPDWANLAVSGATIAVYMGRSVAASVATRLNQAGLGADTTVAVIENASRPGRRLYHGTLNDLPLIEHAAFLDGPVMVIIGDAVAAADLSRSTPLRRLLVPATTAA